MSDLPMDVTADILSRLPVKSLLRFRCASKPWCALIDSPDFIKSHLNRSIETNTNHSIIFRVEDLYSIIDLNSLDNAVELDNPMKNDEGTSLVFSFDGLVVLCKNIYEDVTLWNPSTRKHRKLPVSKVQFRPGFLIIVFFWGLGYDSVNDDYKLVRVVQFDGKEDYDSFDSEVEVYSVKSNTWRRVRDFPYYLLIQGSPGVTFNGAVHWVVTRKPKSDTANLIAAFDVGLEEYRLVPQPDCFDENGHLNVAALGDCLCVVCHYRGVRADIWEMKEYGVKESWIAGSFHYVNPFAYSKSGGEVLLELDTARLFWYDIRRKGLKKLQIRGLESFVEAILCVESLVRLHGDGGTDGMISCQRGSSWCFKQLEEQRSEKVQM